MEKFKKSRQCQKQYIRNAQRRGRSHIVNLERLFLQACMYCGEPTSLGVDRLDNEDGYEVGNVVAACKMSYLFFYFLVMIAKRCNFMKGKMHFSDFLLHVEKIASHAHEARHHKGLGLSSIMLGLRNPS